MNDQTRRTLNLHVDCMAKYWDAYVGIKPVEMKLKACYTRGGSHPKTHKSASSNSGGVGRAGRRMKRQGKRH